MSQRFDRDAAQTRRVGFVIIFAFAAKKSQPEEKKALKTKVRVLPANIVMITLNNIYNDKILSYRLSWHTSFVRDERATLYCLAKKTERATLSRQMVLANRISKRGRSTKRDIIVNNSVDRFMSRK
jgi:hypothetical protein